MDPSKYKIPKRRPIDYGPKVRGATPQSRPIRPIQRPLKPTPAPATPIYSAQQPSRPVATNIPTAAPVKSSPMDPIQRLRPSYKPASSAIPGQGSATKPKKRRKSRKRTKVVLICIVAIAILGALASGGYYYYTHKYKPAHTVVQNTQNINTTDVLGSQDPILNADFIVYGIKEGSLFVTSRSDYVKAPEAPVLNVIAKASVSTDNRQVVISQQKVATNFATDPNGLKKMVDGIGTNTPIKTKAGTSYIITGNATGLTAIGTTLINIRSTASLAVNDWQQLFDSLEPLTI